MKDKVWIALVCCLMVGMPSLVGASDMAGNVESAENELDRTLTGLKDSVVKLVEDNKEIARASEELRLKIKALKSQLPSLEAERVKKVDQLKAVEAKREKKIGGAQGPGHQLAKAMEELADIKAEESRIQLEIDRKSGDQEAARSKIQALQAEIADVKKGADPSQPRPEMAAFRAERDRLLQEVQEVSSRLAKLKVEWDEVNLATVSQPTSQGLAQEIGEKKKQLEILQREVAGLKETSVRQQETVSVFLGQGNAAQFLSDLEADITVQEEGVKALQRDVEALQQKIAGLPKKVAAPKETGDKTLETQYQDAKVRNATLRAELDKLRREMVRLDKKKADIEKGLYGTP